MTAIVRQTRRKQKLDKELADVGLTVAKITTHVGRLAVSTLVYSFDEVADVLTSSAQYAVINSSNYLPHLCMTFAEAADCLDSFLMDVPVRNWVCLSYCGLSELEEYNLDATLHRYPSTITTLRLTQEWFDELEAIVRRALATVDQKSDDRRFR
ncbi:MAG TPA: hypothetical protein VFX20_15850 [Steroidobacteraceae bacterium]|nr:hypothetical protein [Steroidobacteraceae bacterium]